MYSLSPGAPRVVAIWERLCVACLLLLQRFACLFMYTVIKINSYQPCYYNATLWREKERKILDPTGILTQDLYKWVQWPSGMSIWLVIRRSWVWIQAGSWIFFSCSLPPVFGGTSQFPIGCRHSYSQLSQTLCYFKGGPRGRLLCLCIFCPPPLQTTTTTKILTPQAMFVFVTQSMLARCPGGVTLKQLHTLHTSCPQGILPSTEYII